MLDTTKPVQTREGRAATILTTEGHGLYEGDTIVATVATSDRDDYRTVYTFQSNGNYVSGSEGDMDLVNVPVETVEYRTVNSEEDKGGPGRCPKFIFGGIASGSLRSNIAMLPGSYDRARITRLDGAITRIDILR